MLRQNLYIVASVTSWYFITADLFVWTAFADQVHLCKLTRQKYMLVMVPSEPALPTFDRLLNEVFKLLLGLGNPNEV